MENKCSSSWQRVLTICRILCFIRILSRGCKLPSGCFTSAVENFVHQPLGPDVLHVHFMRRFHQCRKCHLNAVLLMPTTLDAVVYQSHQTGGHNCTEKLAVASCGHRDATYSATSFNPLTIVSSLIHNEHGGTQPPLASSSRDSATVNVAGTMWATGCEVSVLIK